MLEFKPGDTVRCVGPRGYMFTMGKDYTVVKYEPKFAGLNFTWPAYVVVKDDYGKLVHCHAWRFEQVALV